MGAVQDPGLVRPESGKLPLLDTPWARIRVLNTAEEQGTQEEAGAEPKRQPKRLGLKNERERAGSGKGPPRREKRGSYSRAGEAPGGAAAARGQEGGKGSESGARVGPGRSNRGDAERLGAARSRQSALGDDAIRRRAWCKPPAARPGLETKTGYRGPSLPRRGTHLLACSWGAPVNQSGLPSSSLPDRGA